MIKTLFHASTVKFDKLKKMNPEGIHVGSEVSALQAAVRHSVKENIYLYAVTVDLGDRIEEYEDICNGWACVIEDCVKDGVTSVMYTNTCEESIYPSYLLFHDSAILSTKCIDEIPYYVALEEIDKLLASEGLLPYNECKTSEEYRLEYEY